MDLRWNIKKTMITNRDELLEYLNADKEALEIGCKNPKLFGNEVWKYEIALRNMEYIINCNVKGIRCLFWKWKYHTLGIKLGFNIPPNVCGKGLKINHYGLIVINENCKIGENCVLQQGINIGRNHEKDDVPIIGNNVYIGPGAKLFGRISIADGCAIGAGAVVTKSFINQNRNIIGNPARESGERKSGL